MPAYPFKCSNKDCKYEIEMFLSMDDAANKNHPTKCPLCHCELYRVREPQHFNFKKNGRLIRGPGETATKGKFPNLVKE